MITTVRARWLAIASAGGAALGHVLDELGALPGVHESAHVRVAVIDPARGPGIALVLVGAWVAGFGADRMLRRSRAAAAGLLLACQLVVAAGLESVARGRLEAGPIEHGGLSAVAIQLTVALAVVAGATLTALALARIPAPTRAGAPPPSSPDVGPHSRMSLTAHVCFQGRAPPRAVRLAHS